MAFVEPRHKTRFHATATLYTPSDSEQMEAHASLDKLRALLPAGINPDDHPTLLFAAGNLAVGSLVNLNDDGLTLEDTLRTYRAFEWQLVDLEHDRGELRGFIVKAGLSEFGTDRLITEEEARAAGKPVNVAIVIALWKVADANLCAFIQRADAPASPDKGKLSFSFEVGFDDYDIVLLPKDASNLVLATARIAPDAPDFEHYDKLLRCNGGKGTTKDQRVARIIMGNIIPLGAGIVTVPAAAVKGITAITSDPHVVTEADLAQYLDAGLYKYSSTQVTLSKEDAAPFKAYAAALPDAHVYTDEKDPTLGRAMDDIHATVLYGIVGADPAPIAACLAGFGPVTMTLGKVAAFTSDDRPYDVLHVEVESPDLHRLHALVKTATATETKWPTYSPHCTIAYLKKGQTAGYVGDTRFAGTKLVFNSITFSPHTGDRVEIPLVTAQTSAHPVYSDDTDEAMATPSRFIPLSDGWQERLAALQAAKDPLVNGVNLTLSDGRKLNNVKVFDGKTLELDKELSMQGVVITDMTPGVGPQADDKPAKKDVYPTQTAEKVADNKAAEADKQAAQQAGYTDAAKAAEVVKATTIQVITDATRPGGLINTAAAGVSSSNPTLPPMKLEDLKQSIASVKTVEDLPQVVANVALFADEMAKASEQMAKERKAAQDAAAAAQTSLDEIKAQLTDLTKKHSEMVAAQQAAAAEAKYNERMAAVEEVFAFDDDIRAEINDEVKACVDDAAFAKWLASAKKKMKGWLKKGEKPGDKKDDKEPDDDADDAKAAKAAKEAIASAKDHVVDPPMHNNLEVNDKTLVEKMKATFAANTSVNGVKVKDMGAKAAK